MGETLSTASEKEAPDTKKEGKKNEIKENVNEAVPVRNFLLIKEVIDNEEDGLHLIGTFVQTVTVRGEFGKFGEEGAEQKYFPYRINDITADEGNGYVIKRRTKHVKEDGEIKAYRTTFQAKLPMKVDEIFDGFPFKVVKATVAIELNTISDERTDRPNPIGEEEDLYRPDLYLHPRDRRNNVSIQEAEKVSPTEEGEVVQQATTEKEWIKLAKEKLDQTTTFDFIAAKPEIHYRYDTKKNYCPRFDVSFYMVESGMTNFVAIFYPLLLICTMNTFHVLYTSKDPGSDEVDAGAISDFIANSAAFALTAVFILPEIIQPGTTQDIFSLNNIYVVMIFVSLSLSSFPATESLSGSFFGGDTWDVSAYAYLGMILFWMSFAIPIFNLVLFFRFVWFLKKKGLPNGPDPMESFKMSDFLKGAGKKVDLKNDDKLVAVREVVLGNKAAYTHDGEVLYKCVKKIGTKTMIVEYQGNFGKV